MRSLSEKSIMDGERSRLQKLLRRDSSCWRSPVPCQTAYLRQEIANLLVVDFKIACPNEVLHVVR